MLGIPFSKITSTFLGIVKGKDIEAKSFNLAIR